MKNIVILLENVRTGGMDLSVGNRRYTEERNLRTTERGEQGS